MSTNFSICQIDDSSGELTPNSRNYERKYRVIADQTTEEVAVSEYVNDWLRDNSLKRLNTAYLTSVQVESQDNAQNKVWEVTVRWQKQNSEARGGTPPKQPPGIIEENFSISEQQVTKHWARQTAHYACTGEVASSFFGMVGQNGQGADISVGTQSFSLKRRYTYESVTSEVRHYWQSCTGKLNLFEFRGYAPGMVKFSGITGNTVTEYTGELIEVDGVVYERARNYFDVTFNFVVASVFTDTLEGATFTHNSHQCVWIETVPADDPDSGRTVDKPAAVHVSDVCNVVDFNGLIQ